MEMIETYIILLVYVTKVIDTNCPPNDNPEFLDCCCKKIYI